MQTKPNAYDDRDATEATNTATILAALRYYQQAGMGDPENRPDDLHAIATNGGEVISLDDAGIDELCEQINLGLDR